MLQKFPEFLHRFPTIKSLAKAAQKDVVIEWRGMGYNNRAVRLHQLARRVVEHHSGRLPRKYDELVALPGIGRYTANALLSSSFHADVPIVDVNVRRVLSRVFWRMKTTVSVRREKEIWTLAEMLLPKGKAYDWNQSLMDLGATICTARTPQCPYCPVAKLCSSRNVMKKAARTRGQEQSMDGIPNRLYRGRIIETLRVHRRRQLNPGIIGKAIHPQYSTKHRQWLELLLAGLEKDGLISRTTKGTWGKRKIALA